MPNAAAPAVEYRGTTDDITTCQHCGRHNLKKTVMLYTLDGDGNREDLLYLGTSCAARMLSVPTAAVTLAAAQADHERTGRIDLLRRRLAGGVEVLRQNWWNYVNNDHPIVIDGVTYGPTEPAGRRFRAFCEARTADWQRELAELTALPRSV